ncbi:YtxH domain-containing protein [Patescibacteria group bacterium]
MSKRGSGLFWGLLAGTALGILFAPKKGKKLREAIKRERDEGGMGLDSVKEGFVSMGREIADTARTAYESEEVQEKISQAREKATDLAEQGTREVKKRARTVRKRATTAAKKTAKKATKKVRGKAKSAARKVKKFTRKKIA